MANSNDVTVLDATPVVAIVKITSAHMLYPFVVVVGRDTREDRRHVRSLTQLIRLRSNLLIDLLRHWFHLVFRGNDKMRHCCGTMTVGMSICG